MRETPAFGLEDLPSPALLLAGLQVVGCNEAAATLFGGHPVDLGALGIPALADGHEVVLTLRRLDGSRFTASVAAAGRPERLLLQITDLTKVLADGQGYSARFYRQVAEHSVDVLWAMDLTGHITYCSPSVAALRGFTPEECEQQGLDALLTPDSMAVASAALQQMLVQPHNATLELEQRRKDGGTVWTEVTASPIFQDGVLVGICGVTRDITERREAKRQLQLAMEEAEAANRAKGEFLAMMSHEVRTPLNGILGLAELLLDGSATESQRDALRTIQASGQSLLTVLNDILDYSKMEAGRLELSPVPFSPAELVAGVAKLWTAQAAAKNIALTVDLLPGLPAQLLGDQDRVRQVLSNLVSNAIKFTAKGAVTVRASALGDDGGLRLVVEDDGIGIQDATDLFEPFRQADPSITRDYGGTGLGLAICQRICAAMGGAIGLAPRPERGTRAEVALPLPAAEKAAAPPMGAQVEAGRPLRLLLAEDNAVNGLVARRMLEKFGHAVTLVSDGQAAVEAVVKGDYDLVLMDVQMPVMDGLAATRAIRQLGERGGLPIIALTANAFPEDRVRCMEAGMDDYVSKPVNATALADALARCTSQG